MVSESVTNIISIGYQSLAVFTIEDLILYSVSRYVLFQHGIYYFG